MVGFPSGCCYMLFPCIRSFMQTKLELKWTLHTRITLYSFVFFFSVLTVIKAKLSEFRIATGEIMFAVYGGTNLSEMQIATKSFVC